MKKFSFFTFVLAFSLVQNSGLASDTPKAKSKPSKSQYNSQIYEKAEDQESGFTAVVKVVREVQGDTEVFFEGKSGLFTVSSPSALNLLIQSQKKKTPVQVKVNMSNRQIQQVEMAPVEATEED